MKISGLQKTTLVDYPGKIAATVFTRGCSFRCPFCHNPELVIPEKFIPLLPEEEILSFFEKRKHQLQGVCITGGEPTIQPDLLQFIAKLKSLGYKIKLDTNGSNPKMLKELIDSGNIDYIAMDIKSSLPKYAMTVLSSRLSVLNENSNDQKKSVISSDIDEVEESRNLMNNIQKSIKLIMDSGIDHEFRTTVCHPIHSVEDFEEIGKMIKGAEKYYLQNFVHSKHIDEHQKFTPFSEEELQKAQKIMKKYCKVSMVR